MKRLLFWSPRILGILFAVFTSLFALDVFEAGYGLGETVLALLMHLIPTGIIVVVLVISWRWAWVGGVLFTSLGALYLVMAWGQSPNSLAPNPLVIPLLLVGGLFLIDWFYRADLRAANH